MGNNQHRYTEEQMAWITQNYPLMGRVKTTEEFNKIFSENRSVGSIRGCAEKLKLKLTNETRCRLNADNFGKIYCSIGTIRISKKTGGEPYIKTENGWEMLKQQVIDCPKGMAIVHLDGNLENCKKDNLMVVEKAILGKMIANDFWSENPQITKTGIIWSQLDLALQRSGAKKPNKKKVYIRKEPDPKTNTGELHITQLNNGKFRLHIRRNGLYINRVSYKTLEDAIKDRDRILFSKDSN